MENTAFKPHKVAVKDRAAHIYVDKGDKTILKVYKGVLKSTMTAALHFLLGLGSRCFEEKHDEQIRDGALIIRPFARIQLDDC